VHTDWTAKSEVGLKNASGKRKKPRGGEETVKAVEEDQKGGEAGWVRKKRGTPGMG